MSPGCEDMKHFQPSKSEDRIILLNLEVSDRKCKKMKMEKSTKKSSCSTSRNIWEWSPEWSAEASGSSLSYLLCFSVGDTIRSQDRQMFCLFLLLSLSVLAAGGTLRSEEVLFLANNMDCLDSPACCREDGLNLNIFLSQKFFSLLRLSVGDTIRR